MVTRSLSTVSVSKPFVMIVMPGTLHVTKLALSFVPSHVNIILILNGLSRWERRWCDAHLRAVAKITSRCSLAHHEVLELLFEHLHSDFGIMDSDLFVLDPVYFNKIQFIGERASLNAFFVERNESTGILIPLTFFLFFNRSSMLAVKAKYRVGCRPYSWQQLPAGAQAVLLRLGFGPQNYAQSYKTYFDTLQTLTLLGMADGFPFATLETWPAISTPSEKLFHVGAVSYWGDLDHIWKIRGGFFSIRALEESSDPQLRKYYAKRFGAVSSEVLKMRLCNDKQPTGPEFFDFVEHLLRRGGN